MLRFLLFLALLATAAGADPMGFRLLDWLPAAHPELHQAITERFSLKPELFPRLSNAGPGVLLLENRGGAPAALIYNAVKLPRGTWTCRFRAQGTGHMCSVRLGTARQDFRPGSEWADYGVTVTVPGPLGPANLAFALEAREARLLLRDLEMVRIPDDVPGLRQEQQVGLEHWKRGLEWGPNLPGEPAVRRWRTLDPQGRLLDAGGWARVGPAVRGPVDESGRVLREGRPFLPLGLYVHDAHKADLEFARDLNLNLVIQHSSEFAAAVPGVQVLFGGEATDIPGLLARHGQKPLFGWSVLDEPEDLARLAAVYRAFQEDGRPLYTSCHSLETVPVLLQYSDIVALDPYPVATVRSPLASVGAWLDRARAVTPPHRSLWVIHQAFAELPLWQRAPTGGELWAMTWNGLNHGGRGVVYYAMQEILAPGFPEGKWNLRESLLAPAIREQAGKLRELERFLVTEKGPTLVPRQDSVEEAYYEADGERLTVLVNLSDENQAGLTAYEVRLTRTAVPSARTRRSAPAARGGSGASLAPARTGRCAASGTGLRSPRPSRTSAHPGPGPAPGPL